MSKNSDVLIFVDTNIYLDFYRAEDPHFQTSMIDHLAKIKSNLIITDQVIMEYFKNRQTVITNTYVSIKKPDWNLKIPACLFESNEYDLIKQNRKKIERNIEELKKRVRLILKNPEKKDRIYKFFLSIVKEKVPYYLNGKNAISSNIVKLAKERFQMGFPPRKLADNTIGDAINWEWILNCAKNTKKDILLVSRDSDYGKNFENEYILNDWLQHEFKEKINKKIKIQLKGKLSEALKIIGEDISSNIEQQEDKIISNNKSLENITIRIDNRNESLYQKFIEVMEKAK